MIAALVILWLLLGLAGALWIRAEDDGCPLLIFLVFIFAGAITLLVCFGSALMEIEI